MIADICLKQGDGIELVNDVRAHYPQLPILVLSMHDETIYAERMLSAGANGYIMKQAASEQFLVALRRVLEGGIYVSEVVGNSMIQKFASAAPIYRRTRSTGLSNRELQILHMIGRGLSTRRRRGAEPVDQDRRVAPPADQAQVEPRDRLAAGPICCELVLRSRSRPGVNRPFSVAPA